MTRFTKLDKQFNPLPADAEEFPFVLDNKQQLIFTAGHLGDDAVDHAEAVKLAAECDLGGVSDWRLPTVEELFLIADRSKKMPAIDSDFFPDTKSDWYWTSTDSAWSAECAWFVHFYHGYAYGLRRDGDAFVRAVRAAPAGQ